MKAQFIIYVISIFIIASGCSTTTYFNLEENNRYYIRTQLDDAKKDKDMGAEVSLLLKDGTEINGELLSIRDSSMILCTEYSATEEELTKLTYYITPIVTNEIQELTIEGSSYIWTGIIKGALVGGVTGYLIGQAGATNDKTDQAFSGLGGSLLGYFLGLTVGGIIGYGLSTEEYILYRIPPDYDFFFLEPFTRYPDKEPEYLEAIK